MLIQTEEESSQQKHTTTAEKTEIMPKHMTVDRSQAIPENMTRSHFLSLPCFVHLLVEDFYLILISHRFFSFDKHIFKERLLLF